MPPKQSRQQLHDEPREPRPDDVVSFELTRDHAEHKAGDTIRITRYQAEKLARPENGFGRLVQPATAEG